MPSIEELLDQAENETSAIEPVNDILEIDPETRTVLIPDSEIIFGVEADQRAERKYFRCPKIVGNNIDLSELEIYVIYQNAGGSDEENRDAYHVLDLEDTGDGYVTFSWELTEKVTRYVGQVSFVVAATRTLSDGTLQNRWSTTIATGKSLIGLQTGMSENEQQQASDLYTQLITELNAKAEIKKSEITTLTNEKKSLLENTGTNQKNLVESEGTKQIQAVENKGTATLAMIPEDYTALNNSVNDLNDIMHMKAPAIVEEATSGTEITVNDSAEGMRLQKLNVYGKSWQKTTTGKNLINADEYYSEFKQSDGTYKAKTVILNDIRISLSEFVGKQVTLSVKVTVSTGTSSVYIAAYIGSEQKRINGSTITSGLTGKSILTVTPVSDTDYFIISYGSGNDDVTFSELQLELGSVSTSYEPYTGGKPSPSPDYPQEIQSAGYVLSTGKNLVNLDAIKNVGWAKTVSVPESMTKLSNDVYTISMKIDLINKSDNFSKTDTAGFGMFDASGKVLKYETVQWNDNKTLNLHINILNTFDWSKIANVIIYGCGNNQIGATGYANFYDFQIEKGTEATSYEPYTGGVPALYQKGIEVGVTGKNLLDADEYYSQFKQSDGTYKGTANAVHNVQIKATYDMIGKTYTISAGITAPAEVAYCVIQCVVNAVSNYSNQIRGGNSGKMIVKFTPASVDDYFVITYGSGGGNIVFSELQLELGTEATTYEPHKQPQSLPIVTPTGLPAIPVPSGTSGITYTDADGQAWIADEIDFARGKYIQRVWQAEFDGSEDEEYDIYGTPDNYYGFYLKGEMLPNVMNLRMGFSNEYIILQKREIKDNSIYLGINNKGIYFIKNKFRDDSLEDKGISNWKAHLAEHPLKVMTYLDTPIETDLSPELIAAYKQIRTNKPTTIISNDADAWMGASYAADTKIWIENKIKEIVTS